MDFKENECCRCDKVMDLLLQSLQPSPHGGSRVSFPGYQYQFIGLRDHQMHLRFQIERRCGIIFRLFHLVYGITLAGWFQIIISMWGACGYGSNLSYERSWTIVSGSGSDIRLDEPGNSVVHQHTIPQIVGQRWLSLCMSSPALPKVNRAPFDMPEASRN